MLIFQAIFAFILTFFISYFVTFLTYRFFIHHGWVEDPAIKQQKTANATALTPVPRGGGIPVFFSILLTCLIFLPLDAHLIGILLGALVTLLIGLWDDLKDISPKTRLFFNFVVAALVVASGIGIAYLSSPFGGILDLSSWQIHFNFFGPRSIWVIPDTLAILWIVWCMNTVGWSAGVEGQLPGFVAISAFFISLLGLRYSADITQWPVIFLALAVCGAFFGFLPFNFYPQKIMPGYSGKSLAGYYLAVLAILSGAKLATVILLLGIPMLDAVYVLTRRLIFHRSLLTPNNIHLHHQLLRLGWSRPQIALFYWILSLILGSTSLFLSSRQKFYVFLGLALVFFSFALRLSRRISQISTPSPHS